MVTQGLISTREDILERAIPLFARLGFHGVSMRDIAAEVEMQAAALYHHFADKEALYLAAMAYAFKDKSVVLQKSGTIRLVLDEWSVENLKLAVLGSSAVVSGAEVID